MMRTIAHSRFFKTCVTMGSSNTDWYICHRLACDFDKVFMDTHLPKWFNNLEDRKWNYYHLSPSLCIISFSLFLCLMLGMEESWCLWGRLAYICLPKSVWLWKCPSFNRASEQQYTEVAHTIAVQSRKGNAENLYSQPSSLRWQTPCV